jgi:DNA-binding GntR family transcriptional regulator
MTDWGPPIRLGTEQEPRTLTEATLERLREDVVSGRLKSGLKVKSESLKEMYGVGTSPIREALFQLAGEGLVRLEGQRGFRVAELNEKELVDITDWRAKLEGEALRRAILNGNLEWEATAVAALYRLKGVQESSGLGKVKAADLWEKRHREFHFALYGTCGSPWLLRFCELLIQNGERYRRAFVQYKQIDRSITEEHEALLDAAIRRDGPRAVAVLEKHIRHAAELARKNLFGSVKQGRSPSRGSSKTRRSTTQSPSVRKAAP